MFEYVVVPAPRRAPKVKGAKTVEARFAHALTEVMNAYGDEGWDYVRSDTLPCDERAGLTGTKTTFQTVLVFRRALSDTDYDAPEADRVSTPEELAAELAPEAPAPEPERAAAMPRLGAGRESAPAPRLGPAGGDEGRVTRFPLPGAERRD